MEAQIYTWAFLALWLRSRVGGKGGGNGVTHIYLFFLLGFAFFSPSIPRAIVLVYVTDLDFRIGVSVCAHIKAGPGFLVGHCWVLFFANTNRCVLFLVFYIFKLNPW